MIILLYEHHPNLIAKVKNYLLKQYNITDVPISTRFIRDLPRYDDSYSVTHLKEECITDYYPLKDQANYIDDINDISLIGDVIASEYIKPQVYFTDDLETVKKWLPKLPDIFAYDTETTGLAVKDIGNITMYSFSTTNIKSIVIIDTPEIRKEVYNYLTTTRKKVVCHNLHFDMRPIFRETGKFIQDYEDTMLLAQAYKNSVKQQSYSLKNLAGGLLGNWANAKTSFNLYEDSFDYVNPDLHYVGNNYDHKKYNLPLIFYAGLDTTATISLWNRFSVLDELPEKVDMLNLLPIREPRDHEDTPRFFYENVLKPLLKTIIELSETPMPIDMNIIADIKQEAINQREPAFDKLQKFPEVVEYMSGVKQALITKFIEPLKQQKDKWPIRVYKHNPADRTFVLNKLTNQTKDSWKIVDIKQYLKDTPNKLIQDILNKEPTLANNPTILGIMSSHRTSNQSKLEEKLNDPLSYIPKKQLTINPNAPIQMRGLWKSLGLESDVLTPGKEESFSKDVLKAILKTTNEENIRNIIEQVLLIASTKNLLAQYIPAYEHSSKDGFCWQSVRFPGTLSYRLSGAIGEVDKSVISPEPLSGFGISMLTQPGTTKKAVVAPEGFIIATSDFAGLETNIAANITHDPTKIRVLNDGYDSHCLHASYYFTKELEELMGEPFEDTLEFNQKFNAMRKEDKALDKLRSNSKGPSLTHKRLHTVMYVENYIYAGNYSLGLPIAA